MMQFIVILLLLLQHCFAAASHSSRNDTIISTRDDAIMDSSSDHEQVHPLKAPNLESARVRVSHDEKFIVDGNHDEAGCEKGHCSRYPARRAITNVAVIGE